MIDDSLFDYGYAVVVMHPYEFSIYDGEAYTNEANQTKFDELKSVISTLKSKGYALLPIDKIDKYDSITFEKIVKNQTDSKVENLTCDCIVFKIA